MGTKKYWLEICVRFSITNFRFDSGVDNRIIIVWEKNEKKKYFEKNFSNFFFHFVRIKTSATIVFLFFFFKWTGFYFASFTFLLSFFFFVEGSRLVNCGMPIVLFFLGCVFDLIFFFKFTLSKWECNCYLGWLCACAMSIIAGI